MVAAFSAARDSHMKLLTIAAVVFIINIPFGYWRDNERKFSFRWILSVHAPVPFVIALRLLSGLGWQIATFPVLIGAFFGGQFAGGQLHRMRKSKAGSRVSSCLVWDLVGTVRKMH
jgi:hypothetical protein